MLNVEPPRAHTRGNHDIQDLFLEISDREFSIRGIDPPVQQKGRVPIFSQFFVQFVSFSLFINKN